MKWLKEVKIPLYQRRSTQDSEGGVHSSYVLLGTFWACYKPVSIASERSTVAVHEIADATFTINKPKSFDESRPTEAVIVWRGRVYDVVRVEDVGGKTRGDVRLYAKQATNTNLEDFLSRVAG